MRMRLFVLVAALSVGHIALEVLAAPAAAQPLSGKLTRATRRYYLSGFPAGSGVNGAGPLTACAQGFHFASLEEIINPAVLKYDSSQAFARTAPDMGAGAPHFDGWVRTGVYSNTNAPRPGMANCAVWTSSASTDLGTDLVLAPYPWDTPALMIAPYVAINLTCNTPSNTWCVED